MGEFLLLIAIFLYTTIALVVKGAFFVAAWMGRTGAWFYYRLFPSGRLIY